MTWVHVLACPYGGHRVLTIFMTSLLSRRTHKVNKHKTLLSTQKLISRNRLPAKIILKVCINVAGSPLKCCLAKECAKQYFFFLYDIGPSLYCECGGQLRLKLYARVVFEWLFTTSRHSKKGLKRVWGTFL